MQEPVVMTKAAAKTTAADPTQLVATQRPKLVLPPTPAKRAAADSSDGGSPCKAAKIGSLPSHASCDVFAFCGFAFC